MQLIFKYHDYTNLQSIQQYYLFYSSCFPENLKNSWGFLFIENN